MFIKEEGKEDKPHNHPILKLQVEPLTCPNCRNEPGRNEPRRVLVAGYIIDNLKPVIYCPRCGWWKERGV